MRWWGGANQKCLGQLKEVATSRVGVQVRILSDLIGEAQERLPAIQPQGRLGRSTILTAHVFLRNDLGFSEDDMISDIIWHHMLDTV